MGRDPAALTDLARRTEHPVLLERVPEGILGEPELDGVPRAMTAVGRSEFVYWLVVSVSPADRREPTRRQSYDRIMAPRRINGRPRANARGVLYSAPGPLQPRRRAPDVC
jgi:hypothetical protein